MHDKESKMDYYSIKEFDDTGLVVTAFTSMGHGCWFSNDPNGHAGYREVAAHFGIRAEDMAATFQRHSAVVREVTSKDSGMNVLWRNDPIEVADGVVTNERNFMISSMESDCTPVYILDPIKKAIGMVHSGWKGTLQNISINAIELMGKLYGTLPADVMIAFGPCICKDCYEVGGDLRESFSSNYNEVELARLFAPKSNGKFNLDIKEAIRISLLKAGIQEKNIFDTDYCTYHSGLFYSHRLRAQQGLPTTENMFTGIMLL